MNKKCNNSYIKGRILLSCIGLNLIVIFIYIIYEIINLINKLKDYIIY